MIEKHDIISYKDKRYQCIRQLNEEVWEEYMPYETLLWGEEWLVLELETGKLFSMYFVNSEPTSIEPWEGNTEEVDIKTTAKTAVTKGHGVTIYTIVTTITIMKSKPKTKN